MNTACLSTWQCENRNPQKNRKAQEAPVRLSAIALYSSALWLCGVDCACLAELGWRYDAEDKHLCNAIVRVGCAHNFRAVGHLQYPNAEHLRLLEKTSASA